MPNKKRVTLKDVANKAGVSVMTVSNVLNDWPRVKEKTRKKVQAAIRELGYRPNTVARSLVTGQTKTIGVMIPDITNPFFGQTVRGCEDVLYSSGYSILLCNTNENQEKERCYLEMLVDRGVDGLLIFGARSPSIVLSEVVHDDIPIIAEDSPAQHDNTSVIDIDNVGGAYTATKHLIDLGHKHIGHLTGPDQRLAAIRRLEGYKNALEDTGIKYDSSYIEGGFPSIRGGYQATMRLIDSQEVTALFCYNDLMAIGAMLACQHQEISVPEEMAIVGFDDIAMAMLVTPALTTIQVSQFHMGKLASELLLERLSGKKVTREHILFPVTLIVRNSCGAQQLSKKQIKEMYDQLAISDGVDLYSESSHPTECDNKKL